MCFPLGELRVGAADVLSLPGAHPAVNQVLLVLSPDVPIVLDQLSHRLFAVSIRSRSSTPSR